MWRIFRVSTAWSSDIIRCVLSTCAPRVALNNHVIDCMHRSASPSAWGPYSGDASVIVGWLLMYSLRPANALIAGSLPDLMITMLCPMFEASCIWRRERLLPFLRPLKTYFKLAVFGTTRQLVATAPLLETRIVAEVLRD